MASVALAAPQGVYDNLQTCSTVYKSGMMVESTIPVFFCNILLVHLGHGMDLFAKFNGFRKLSAKTQCFVCFSGSIFENQFCSGSLLVGSS